MNPQKYDPVPGRSVQIDEVDWVDFPGPLSQGGIRWKLLNVAPELGSWAAILRLPERLVFCEVTSMSARENIFLTKGHMEVRGGEGRRRRQRKSPRLRLRGLPGLSWVDKLS